MTDVTAPIIIEKSGPLHINRDFRKLLTSAGLDSFDALYGYPGGEVVKDIRERSVTRIDIEAGGTTRRFYLKRHRTEQTGIRGLLSRWLLGRSPAQGCKEFDTLCDFRKHGLPTVVPVAAGERRTGLFRTESFVLTEDFSPFVSLEEIIRERPEFLEGPAGEVRKAILLRQIGRLARQMHQSGFNHRDFNATHVLLHYEDRKGVPRTALFDLQRVDRRKYLRFRWIIKTIAEVNYTLPEGLFSPQDRLRLFLAYKGKSCLGLRDRVQWLWIRRKTARISRHTDHIMARRAERRRKGLPER
ncbi:lipopolysaccharide core heptose(I) kinase RfaP [Desulfonema ishimotonii]|uniref:Lipopolysaccharide core heptose(I) kinase RfaP n=1 Tax=Desulfonema ishimotonii TaxID=45657 RepID=A0A401FXD9_9BACT|nr:lipopolysaccharide kinase InaA family protein [Desulfonema ishimotonii]GBC61631.1 lipopolysaccharide core heptose(I) kinase RfaP [Desulfonema ishimotonii]